MRKGLKKILCIFTAATLICGAASLAACGYSFTPPEGGPNAEAEVKSNGGFAVQKGEYIYFINGVETYTADNDYGAPAKGSLMRIKAADADAGNNTAELVIPSLMVAGDYTAGIFIYGDRIYYATPNNMKNTSGVVENTYLDFKSAKLDGTDIKDYFYVSDNTTQYRYVEVDGAVYLMYAGKDDGDNSALLSYNTATGAETVLASGYLAFSFHSTDKTDPWIYYTMPVPNEAGSQDGTSTLQFDYRQIYRVRADATQAPYEYHWTDAFLEATDGKAPYTNLGEIVLDGRGALSGGTTQYNHSQSEPLSKSYGYTYTLRSYTNGGIYFVRGDGQDSSSSNGYLYYLPVSKLAAGWDSVTGNGDDVLEKVSVGSKTTGAELYFIVKDGETNVHHYLYVKGSEIHNVTAAADGSIESEVSIASDVSGATLKFIDDSDATYKYVYYTKSNGSGTSVERAVYNGKAEYYNNLTYPGENNEAYRAVKLLDVQHATGWYDYEVINGTVFYADAATVGSTSYNYVTAVNIKNADGTLKNNAEIKAFNDKYEEIMGSKGLVQTLSSNSNSKLSALISYYFKTGETIAYEDNLAEARDNGRSDTYLFTEAEKTAFKAFIDEKGDVSGSALFGENDYKDENGKYYRNYTYFATKIGQVDEEDMDAMALAWRNAIQRDVAPEEEETAALEGWEIALIVIAAVLFAGGCAGIAVWYVLRKRKNAQRPAPERMAVDTTDDRSVDVYAEGAAEEPAEPAEIPAEEAEEPAAEPAEEAEETADPAETPAETPAEEPAETPAEQPAEQPAETSPDEPQA